MQGKRDTVKEQVTAEMLEEVIDIYISETDTVSLLDMPSTTVSVDADDAEAIMWACSHHPKFLIYFTNPTSTFPGKDTPLLIF